MCYGLHQIIGDTIKIATINGQGLSTLSKRLDVFDFYRKKCYSVLCLQDTHFVKDNEPIVETQWGYTCMFNSYKSNARGLCILLSNNFEFKIHNIKKDDDGNFLAIDLTLEE